MNWLLIGAIAAIGAIILRNQFRVVYVSLIVAGQEIVTGSINLVELAKASAAGNRITVRDDPGIKTSAYFIGSDLHFDVTLDIGVAGVRLTKSVDVNVGSPTRFLGKGQTIPIIDKPVEVDLNIRVGL